MHTQLPTFSLQANPDDVVDEHQHSLLYFQSSLAEHLKILYLHVLIRIKTSNLDVRVFKRTVHEEASLIQIGLIHLYIL